MKRSRIFTRFLTAIGALCLILILIWIIFYMLTRSLIDRTYDAQLESDSKAVLYGIEEELLLLENRAFVLSHSREILEMLDAADSISFYEKGARLAGERGTLSAHLSGVDHVIVYDADGLFFRLKGSIDNTALKRTRSLMENSASGILTVSSGGDNYIGIYEPVKDDGVVRGYVALLAAQTGIERILQAYNRSAEIGGILYSGDRILCSDRPVMHASLDRIRQEAAFVNEKEIGLSGFGLMLYSERSGAAEVAAYFRVALPVTIAILLLTTGLFVRYTRNNMVEPIELLRERTLKYLLKKQINAHFTVNTLNVIRALIRKGDEQTASDTCDELAAMLRYANAGEEMISLMEEFYVLEQYIDIMRTRYPGIIGADIGMDETFEDIMIPRMLLQPVVENAIDHGLAGNPGRIGVSARTEADDLYITIRDDGKGMDADRLAALTASLQDADQPEVGEPGELHHIALRNIQGRIQMLWSEAYGMHIRSAPGAGTEVTLHLPLIRRDPAEVAQTP